MNRIVIVLPTYNEAGNIVELLNEIHKQKIPKYEIHVLVVDDNSPDGTAELVRSYPSKRVHLVIRQAKEGLGKAYTFGMQYALSNLNPSIVMEMDADFSHDPNDIGLLVNAITEGADFVIGSRYIDGGSIPEDWGMHRVLISKTANVATRTILGIQGITDCSGGFRAIKADLLRRIGLDDFTVKGYAFQAILLDAALQQGAIVKEIPISFSNRKLGDSKMSFGDMAEGFTALIGARIERALT